ncbi:HAMP domain-containing sensor histidine kinase [Tenacibaculum sp. IB213877]|uniref:sensor histidine kinase n=1 Tax=Tenacibaculum sp. IB213877 TaxID=3097351 RepID=UPI002A59F09C|nr:HAMP domain-containing sensor histidine kinase [Tenacibaculum sp. IB213877]MDY0780200.1 HAMP domain-containing sensor histidine kinase [Tenacibaculum sp. IB213877]
MSFLSNTFWVKRITILVSFFIVSLILWNTYIFFQKFKQDERAKMEIFASAIKEFESNTDLNASFNLETKVFENIKDIPLILTDDKENIISSHNLDSVKSTDKKYLQNQLQLMKHQNQPIVINYLKNKKQFVYYRNSDLLYKLTYYPLALLLILGLFLTVVYLFFNSNKIAEQNKLWTGMAKETAHQIGTPLSSLLGWIAILRAENISEDYVDEIEKDVNRLSTIANRFSKIGSLPELKPQNIVEITKKAYDYLESRSSKQISFSFSTSKEVIESNLNTELYGWVIENLIKNAIDAMQGKGAVSVSIFESDKKVKILVTDTGKGIPKSQFKQIFKPGFTTKKRGWGLGLSLSKRIIKDYHKGKIFVQKSELGKGTTFEIILNTI